MDIFRTAMQIAKQTEDILRQRQPQYLN